MKLLFAAIIFAVTGFPSLAEAKTTCSTLPEYTALKTALIEARDATNGGLNLDMWGTVVDRTGRVCAVAYTGEDAGAQWPGSRLISAQKANTANAFGLDGLALSTANLFSAVQPGGSLFGLQQSNPINVPVAYNKVGNLDNFGTTNDPLIGELIGGVNVFGGGLALYNAAGKIVGAIGVSGDTSCADSVNNPAPKAIRNERMNQCERPETSNAFSASDRFSSNCLRAISLSYLRLLRAAKDQLQTEFAHQCPRPPFD